MRFYRVEITNPSTGAQVLPSSLGGMSITSLLPSGKFNPSALNIEFDISTLNASDPDNNSWIRIWGLGLKDTSAALDLNGANIEISIGMSSGLPLANPKQQGLVAKGSIYQAFGNWIGTDQTIDLNIISGTTVRDRSNFPFTWKAGTQLSTAIGQTLGIALPSLKQNISISKNLVVGNDENGVYRDIQQFAAFINNRSKAIVGGTYPGVTISTDGVTVTAFDGTTAPPASKTKKIDFQDMIGQPTWIQPQTISVVFVARGDLSVGDTISLPQSQQTLTIAAQTRFQDKSSFTGNFLVTNVHHYGNFRQASASAWNTTIQAVQVPSK